MTHSINLSKINTFVEFDKQIQNAKIHQGFLGGRKVSGNSMNAIVNKYSQLAQKIEGNDVEYKARERAIIKIQNLENQKFVPTGFGKLVYKVLKALGNFFAKFIYPKNVQTGARFDRKIIIDSDIAQIDLATRKEEEGKQKVKVDLHSLKDIYSEKQVDEYLFAAGEVMFDAKDSDKELIKKKIETFVNYMLQNKPKSPITGEQLDEYLRDSKVSAEEMIKQISTM